MVDRATSLPNWLQLPAVVALLIWAYLPFTKTPILEWHGVPFRSTDFLAFVLLGNVTLALLASRIRNSGFRKACRPVAVALTAVLVYAAISMSWADLNYRDQIGMTFTLVGGLTSFLIPYLAYQKLTSEQIRLLLFRLSFFLALISFSYFVEAFLGFGLRTANDVEVATFGIRRMGGPLLYPAKAHFQLLPALGFTLGEMFAGRLKKTIAIPVAIMIAFALVGAGSRSGLACLGLFIILVGATLKGKQRVIAIAGAVLIVGSSMAVVFSKAMPDRLKGTDEMREATYSTSFAIVADQSMKEHLFGAGYGHWWPWYVTDLEDGGATATKRFIQPTGYGQTLYNPHSLFLMTWVELGAVGVCFFTILIAFLARFAMVAKRTAGLSPLLCSLAALIPAFFVDFYLLKAIPEAFVWWTFALGALCLTRAQTRTNAPPQKRRKGASGNLQPNAEEPTPIPLAVRGWGPATQETT